MSPPCPGLFMPVATCLLSRCPSYRALVQIRTIDSIVPQYAGAVPSESVQFPAEPYFADKCAYTQTNDPLASLPPRGRRIAVPEDNGTADESIGAAHSHEWVQCEWRTYLPQRICGARRNSRSQDLSIQRFASGDLHPVESQRMVSTPNDESASHIDNRARIA